MDASVIYIYAVDDAIGFCFFSNTGAMIQQPT